MFMPRRIHLPKFFHILNYASVHLFHKKYLEHLDAIRSTQNNYILHPSFAIKSNISQIKCPKSSASYLEDESEFRILSTFMGIVLNQISNMRITKSQYHNAQLTFTHLSFISSVCKMAKRSSLVGKYLTRPGLNIQLLTKFIFITCR